MLDLLTLIGGFLLPSLVAAMWPRWNGSLALAFVVAIGVGWGSILMSNEMWGAGRREAIGAKAARGDVLSENEKMFDGVGDNAASLFCGWVPATMGVGAVLGVRALLRRRGANGVAQ